VSKLDSQIFFLKLDYASSEKQSNIALTNGDRMKNLLLTATVLFTLSSCVSSEKREPNQVIDLGGKSSPSGSISTFAVEIGDSVGSKAYMDMGRVLNKNTDGTFTVKFNSGGHANCSSDDLGKVDSCVMNKSLCAGDITVKKGDNAEFIVRAIFQDGSVLAERMAGVRSYSVHKSLLERKYNNR
jgi:hypothetical protein